MHFSWNRHAVICALFAWLLGIIVGVLWTQSGAWIVTVLCLMLVPWRRHVRLGTLMIVVACLFGAWCWGSSQMQTWTERKSDFGALVGWSGYTHEVSGRVGPLLGLNEYKKRYHYTLESIDDAPVSPAHVVLLVPSNLSLLPGDSVHATGRFDFPADTSDFLAEKQLWHRGFIAELSAFQSTKESAGQYDVFTRMQQWFDRQLRDLFPRQGHQILSGILLGQRTDMDPSLRDQLKASGLMHLMVVSGGNVIMLIVFLSLFIRWFPIWIRILIIASTIIAFVFLVGGDMPVWRAALMGIVGYVVSLWGWRLPALILPLGIAALMSLAYPLSIVYDIGLQLSFLSVVCIVVWGKSITHTFRALGPFFSEAVSLTLAATIGTFPITLFYFGTFSLVSPLANLFAAPAIPVLMYGGIAALFASTFSDTLARWIGYIPWIATTYLYRVIEFFGSRSWSLVTVELGIYRPYFIVFSLVILILAIIRHYRGISDH